VSAGAGAGLQERWAILGPAREKRLATKNALGYAP